MKKIRILVFCILIFCFPLHTQAAQPREEAGEEVQEEAEDALLAEFEFSGMESFLKKIFPDEKLGFQDMIRGLISGEFDFSAGFLKELIAEQFFYELKSTRSALMHVIAIAVIAAVFRNFSDVFQNSQISETCFFVLYMLLITICLNSFRILTAAAASGLSLLLEFLKLLGPVYFMAVAFATGSVTSIAFYNMILLLIMIVELVIQSFLLPLAQLYIVIRILNDLSVEGYLSKFAELIHTVIAWSLKTLTGAVIGINLIQSLLAPAIDSVKRSVVLRGGEAVPLIGDMLGGAAEVVLGTAVLIKNGIGVAGAVICVAICITPVIQMALVALMYKLTAALVQPISEKRVVGCIGSMADGAGILLKIVLTSGILFLITIAVVANSMT